MTSATPTSVRVRDLARRYGPVEALRGVTFEIARGEIFGLLGPNGAGKTTALECILGLRRPDSGSIEIEGIDAVAHPHEAKQRVGALLQAAMLQDKITPRRALGLFASFYREAADVESLIERFGLVEKSDAAFGTLSGGQRQRLFLALAFVNNPRLVVLDEPTAGLDPKSRRDLHASIAGMRDSGRTVLLSTHDLEEARQLCDRIGIVDRGRIVALGRPDELIENFSAASGTANASLGDVFFSVTGRSWSEEPGDEQ
jgi:ABC-2 type transport system ATP-binding protein